MKLLGNIIWFIFIGLWEGLLYLFAGVIFYITIIGIPFGKQLFKMSSLAFTPFGAEVKTDFEKHPIANVIWLIFFGLGSCLGYVFAGIIFCITIIGIPFGKQCFKLAKLTLIPFGAEVNK